MPSYSTQRRVPFTPKEMFDVVADVERYPEFLPLCESLTVASRTSGGGRETILATMGVGYKAIREAFTSRVTLMPAELTILVENVAGPFRQLANRWHFSAAPGGTDVHFSIDHEFSSALLRLLMGALFDKAVRRYAEAFEIRAHSIYGARSDAS
jgi:coenzyme Q-binding protein COQ10